MNNRRVLITGASSGIGAACARAFARKGAHLLLCARREERLKKLGDELRREHGVEVELLVADVREYEALQAEFKRLPAVWRAIDILVNNAGMVKGLDKLQDGKIGDWQQMVDTNVKGLLHATHLVLPQMVQRNSGHIINIGSISSHGVYSGGTVYCATKHAVRALSSGLQLDLLGTQVKVSSVDPGLVETEFSQVRFSGDLEKAKAVYQGFTPLSAQDVAESVLFCAQQPAHVNIAEIIVLPTAQRSVSHVSRTDQS